MSYKRGKSYVVQWRENGRKRTATCPTKAMADQLEAKLKVESFMIERGITTRDALDYAAARNLSIRHALEKLDAHYQSQARTGAITKAHAKESVRRAKYAAELLNLVTVGQIDDAAISKLVDICLARQLSSKSVNCYRAGLVELKRFSLHGPRKTLQKTPPRQVSRVLSPLEVHAILSLPHPHSTEKLRRRHPRTDFYAVTLFTGLRWNEARRLDWSNVNFDAAGGPSLELRVDQTKTKAAATVPLPSIVADLLRDRQRRLGAVGRVPIFSSTPMRRSWLRDLERAGVPIEVNGETANRKCARKTYTTWLAQAGVDEGTRVRLRRDVGELHERVYTDRTKLFDSMRAGVNKLEVWYQRCLCAATPAPNEVKRG